MSPVTNSLYPQPILIDPQPLPSNGTRFWGGVKTLGGVAETIAGSGLAIGTSWTGAGGVAGGAIAVHGLDSSLSGVKQIYTGVEERSYTARGLTSLSGSSLFGDIVDGAIGLVGTAGAALTKVTAGFSKIRIPRVWKSRVWRFGELPYGVYGSTDPVGNIVIQRGLEGKELKTVLDHELVHRFFSPGTGIFQKIRAQISTAGYANSQLLRYTEEALAEAYATGSPMQGALHPIVNGYDITLQGLAAEGSVAAGGIVKGVELGENFEQN